MHLNSSLNILKYSNRAAGHASCHNVGGGTSNRVVTYLSKLYLPL